MAVRATIAVIDPGLMELGGHHAALLHTLASDSIAPSIHYYCHQAVDKRLIELAVKTNSHITPCFKSNFYGVMDDDSADNFAAGYANIATLSNEYAHALTLAEGASVVFLPCLSWQHLLAFAQARTTSRNKAKIKACLMFPPGVNHRGELRDGHLATQYKLAIQLALKANIELFVSDTALQQGFEALLGKQLPLHPSYLANWQQLPKGKPQAKNHLLYFGDAKVEKGFNRLPSIARSVLSDSDPTLSAHIQFNQNWDLPEIDEAKKALEKLVETDQRLTISTDYLGTQQLALLLANASHVYQLYKSSDYLNKSSGLDWWIKFYSHLEVLPNHLGRERLAGESKQALDCYFQSLGDWLLR